MRFPTFNSRACLAAFALAISFALAPRLCPACPYTFRQAGFIIGESTPYQLCLLVDHKTPDQGNLAAWIKAAADAYLPDSNVEAKLVNIDAKIDDGLASQLRRLKVPRYPTAVLLSPRGQSWILGDFSSRDLCSRDVEQLVRGAVGSPARDQMIKHIVSDWCVILLLKGADEARNKRAEQAFRAAAKEVVGSPTESGEPIQRSPHVLVLSPGNPKERIFLESLGLGGDSPGRPRGAILFGKGRRFGPVLEEGFLEKSYVLSLLRLLGNNCACTADPIWLSGPASPLDWPVDIQKKVRDALGFDPNSPQAAMAVASLQELVDPQGASASQWAGGKDPILSGYQEFYLGDDAATPTPPPNK